MTLFADVTSRVVAQQHVDVTCGHVLINEQTVRIIDTEVSRLRVTLLSSLAAVITHNALEEGSTFSALANKMDSTLALISGFDSMTGKYAEHMCVRASWMYTRTLGSSAEVSSKNSSSSCTLLANNCGAFLLRAPMAEYVEPRNCDVTVVELVGVNCQKSLDTYVLLEPRVVWGRQVTSAGQKIESEPSFECTCRRLFSAPIVRMKWQLASCASWIQCQRAPRRWVVVWRGNCLRRL